MKGKLNLLVGLFLATILLIGVISGRLDNEPFPVMADIFLMSINFGIFLGKNE